MALDGKDSSLIFQATGKKRKNLDLGLLDVMWIVCWICPPSKQKAKSKHNIVKGIYFGMFFVHIWISYDPVVIQLLNKAC